MEMHIDAPENFPEPARAANIEPGRQDYISTLLRLVRMELYKLRRRTYSKITLFILLGLVVAGVLLLGFASLSQVNAPASSFVPPRCSANTTSYCTTRTYTPAQLEQIKNQQLQANARELGFPSSFMTIASVLSEPILALLGLILVGAISGTEYGMGTIRLLFTRGPTRLQCMLAKILASLVYIVVIMLLLIVAYMLVGMLAYPLAGEPYSYTFGLLHAANFGKTLGNTLLLVLITVAGWFFYGLLALFFGTLGRSTAAALGATIAWFILEMLLGYILGFLPGLFSSGPMHDLVTALPAYLPSNNFAALVQNRLHGLGSQSPASISDAHALIVIGVYMVVLIGTSCWLAARRDVTN